MVTWSFCWFFVFFFFRVRAAAGCPASSDEELLDRQLQLVDLVLELAALVGGDAGSDHGAGHAAGAAKRRLGGDKDVRDVLRSAGGMV